MVDNDFNADGEDKYSKKPILLYGGSVDSSNIRDIINIDCLTTFFNESLFIRLYNFVWGKNIPITFFGVTPILVIGVFLYKKKKTL